MTRRDVREDMKLQQHHSVNLTPQNEAAPCRLSTPSVTPTYARRVSCDVITNTETNRQTDSTVHGSARNSDVSWNEPEQVRGVATQTVLTGLLTHPPADG